MSRSRRLAAVVAAATLAVSLAACSGSADSNQVESSTPSDTADLPEGVQEAISIVEENSTPPDALPVTEAIQGAIPTGKNIAIMVCGQPACDVNFGYMTEAAEHLGWTTKQYIAGPTPDKNKEAWDLVVQQKPDAVISIGFPQALWAENSKKLEAMGIPVVECCTADDAGENGVIFNENGPDSGVAGGALQADWVVADSQGKANAVYLDVPAFPILGLQAQGFEDEMKRLCPDCGYDKLDLNVADVGTPAEKQVIVSYLQSHPDVDYIVAGTDDSLQGAPAALSAAGLANRVKAIGLAPSEANLNYIKQGQVEVATIAFPRQELSWATVDALARHFTDNSLDPIDIVLPRLILTADNIEDPNTIPISTPSYQEDFLELWGKS
jgi:ABC-type sugar transport system substrate-binding protein